MSGMKVKELMDSLKGDCYRFRVHYPEEWEFGLITGATFFGKRGLVLQPLPITSPAQTCHGRRGLLPAPILTAPSKSRP